MLDRFNRRIEYLRISVTDRCNLRCRYCMPESGVKLLPHDKILSFEEILSVVRAAVKMGINKIRLTGGEPLVRQDIVELVAMLADVDRIGDYAMTTNGIFLEEFAAPLAKAGLHRVNVSLDALNPQRYRWITRGGDVRRVLAGIEAAKSAGLVPVKLNCVVERSPDEPDAKEVAAFAKAKGLDVRFIRRMNLETGQFWQVHGGTGGDCKLCNRLRLSSDGLLRPCLFTDLVFNVRELGPQEAIRRAVEAKPESGRNSKTSTFYGIGG